MGRPKLEKQRSARVECRTYPEIAAAVERYANEEGRTVSQMMEFMLREAILSRRRRDLESEDDIHELFY